MRPVPPRVLSPRKPSVSGRSCSRAELRRLVWVAPVDPFSLRPFGLLRGAGECSILVNAAARPGYTSRILCVYLQRSVSRTLRQPLDSGTTARRNEIEEFSRRIVWRTQSLAEGGHPLPDTDGTSLDPKLSVSRKVAGDLDSKLPPLARPVAAPTRKRHRFRDRGSPLKRLTTAPVEIRINCARTKCGPRQKAGAVSNPAELLPSTAMRFATPDLSDRSGICGGHRKARN